jgi:CheY-like chemotaxis protein
MTEGIAGLNPARLSILVVDANTFHRNIILEVLRGVGITRVQQAASGAEAIEELRTWHPKLLVCEADIEGMDGLELVRQVRAGEVVPNRAMPIVMLTTRTTRAFVEEARLAGVDEFIIKPITPAVLLRRIEEVMKRPRRFVDSPAFVGPCRRRRKNVEYVGELRRMSDPLPADRTDEVIEEKKKEVAKTVTRLQHLVNDLCPGDRSHLRAVYEGTLETKEMATGMGDPLLERSASAMVGYLEGVGATKRMDGEVVGTCLQALLQLIQLPNALHNERELVVIGVEKMVKKKLAASAAGETPVRPVRADADTSVLDAMFGMKGDAA